MDNLYIFGIVDPSLCSDRAVRSWTSFTWGLFDFLTTPALTLPVIAMLIVLPWLVRRFPWKYLTSGLGVALFITIILLSSNTVVAIGNKALVTFVPNDRGEQADAIVILGRGGDLRQQRVEVAAQLWKQDRAPLLFASGWGDAHEIAADLKQQGIPESAIAGEPCSRTTEENALFTAALLQPQVKRILLVTDTPHMLRSLLTFRSLGFTVISHPNPLPDISKRRKGFLVYREYLGLVSYGILGRFSPREAPAELPIKTASKP